MLEIALSAFVMLLVTISPIDVGSIFIGLTRSDPAARHGLAIKATVIAALVLGLFALCGNWLIATLGVSFAAFRISGGVLLMLLSIDLLFAHPTGLSSITESEAREAGWHQDIAVFPLAIPLIAGPGAMTAVLLLMGRAGGDPLKSAIVLGALALVLLLTLASLLSAAALVRVLGITGINVVSRISGVLLAALSVQFVIDGIRESGLLPG
jgi:multiple antibiotic resistance protein